MFRQGIPSGRVLAIEAAQKIEDGGGELVVAVSRDHVPGAAHVDILGVRNEIEKFARVHFVHKLGCAAAHQQRRNLQGTGGGDELCFKRLAPLVDRPPAVQKSWVPVPTPASIRTLAQILLQAFVRAWTRPMRQIRRDDLGCLGNLGIPF